MPTDKCCMCKNFYGCAGISFHKIPKDIEAKQKWMVAIGTDVKDSARICSDHFAPEYFKEVFKRGTSTIRTLKRGAVPSLLLLNNSKVSNDSKEFVCINDVKNLSVDENEQFATCATSHTPQKLIAHVDNEPVKSSLHKVLPIEQMSQDVYDAEKISLDVKNIETFSSSPKSPHLFESSADCSLQKNAKTQPIIPKNSEKTILTHGTSSSCSLPVITHLNNLHQKDTYIQTYVKIDPSQTKLSSNSTIKKHRTVRYVGDLTPQDFTCLEGYKVVHTYYVTSKRKLDCQRKVITRLKAKLKTAKDLILLLKDKD